MRVGGTAHYIPQPDTAVPTHGRHPSHRPDTLTHMPPDDTATSWARRQENLRGTLKLLRVIVAACRAHAELVERRYGLHGAQLWMLHELAQHPSLRIVDLAKGMAIHRAIVEQLAGGLAARGLISWDTAPAVPPRHRLRLAPAGRQLLATLDAPPQGPFNAALEHLDDHALAQLIAGLSEVSRHFTRTDPHAALRPLADILAPHAPMPPGNRDSRSCISPSTCS